MLVTVRLPVGSNGWDPLRMAYISTPQLHMSALVSKPPPACTSGAAYAHVPAMLRSLLVWCRARARPKSATRARASSSMEDSRMFSGWSCREREGGEVTPGRPAGSVSARYPAMGAGQAHLEVAVHDALLVEEVEGAEEGADVLGRRVLAVRASADQAVEQLTTRRAAGRGMAAVSPRPGRGRAVRQRTAPTPAAGRPPFRRPRPG